MHKFNIDDPRFFMVYDCRTFYNQDGLNIMVKFAQFEELKRREKYGNDFVSRFNSYHYNLTFIKVYDDPDNINIAHEFSFMADELEEAFEEFVVRGFKQKQANKAKAEFWLNMGCA